MSKKRPNHQAQEPPAATSPAINEPTPVPLPSRSHKKPIILAAIILILVGASSAFFLISGSDDPATTKISIRPPQAKPAPIKDVQKLVKVTYTHTSPPGAQNTDDQQPILADGSYLELNGNGALTYNGAVVANDPRIEDAVLSSNGKHYAYRLELQSEDNGQLPTESELYIDGKKVADLGQASLLAVADNGVDYLTKDYTSTITRTTYNTGIREEVIKLNDTQTIVSSLYGFLDGEYSPDLKTILVKARNYDVGSTWYVNGTVLNSCSYDRSTLANAPIFRPQLSNTGTDTMCLLFHSAQVGPDNSFAYSITGFQSYIDDSAVFDQPKTFTGIDNGTLAGFADKTHWLFIAGNQVLFSDGSVKSLNDILPGTASALNEPSCSDTGDSGQSLVYISDNKLALLIPCSQQKLFSKGFSFSNTVNLSQQNPTDIQYDQADHTLYIYTD